MLPHTALAMPSDEVEVRVYEPLLLPTSTWPYEGVVERPVPPNAIESVEVADTAPFIACSGPVRAPIYSELVVLFKKSAFAKCEVDEAKMPACAQNGEVVAAEMRPKLGAQINGFAAPAAVWSVPHTIKPAALVSRASLQFSMSVWMLEVAPRVSLSTQYAKRFAVPLPSIVPLPPPPNVLKPFTVEPVIVAFVMVMPSSLSMRCVSAILLVTPPDDGNELLVLSHENKSARMRLSS
jgi:hypothetical protein